MKETVIGKYKELVDYYESMFDTIYKRFKGTDEPEEWQLKPNSKGAILKSEIAELEHNNPALREDNLTWHKISKETPPNDIQVLVCLERPMTGGVYQVATFGKLPVIGTVFAWDAPKVIQWTYIPEYIESRQEKHQNNQSLREESFRVDNFNQKRLLKDLDDDIETVRKQFERKPSDQDIENAALDYVDEESNHFARQAKRVAYIQGAKDMRDNNIFIAPQEKPNAKE